MHAMSYAEAVGEIEPRPIAWVPGENFDPYDEQEMEVMRHVWAQERADRIAALERENAYLQRELQLMAERLRD